MKQDPKLVSITVEQLKILLDHKAEHQQICVTQEQLDSTRRELSNQIERNRAEINEFKRGLLAEPKAAKKVKRKLYVYEAMAVAIGITAMSASIYFSFFAN